MDRSFKVSKGLDESNDISSTPRTKLGAADVVYVNRDVYPLGRRQEVRPTSEYQERLAPLPSSSPTRCDTAIAYVQGTKDTRLASVTTRYGLSTILHFLCIQSALHQ